MASRPDVEPARSGSSPMTIARVGELGIVGAGGGGFPTAVKLGTRVPLVIANAAECEQLLHKDKELLHHLAEPARLGLSGFNNVGPLTDYEFSPSRVVLPLKQHAGVPALPVVKTGDRVRAGDLLAQPEAGKLGARIHASIGGVARLTHDAVVIDAN